MKQLVHEKATAVTLRKKGYTYKEISLVVPVAKSSLSLWLKDLQLTKSEKNSLKKRKHARITHGRAKVAGVLQTMRFEREKIQWQEAKATFEKYADEPLFHTGIALYWAEGGKRTNQCQFVNSDYEMQQVMVQWLMRYSNTELVSVRCRLFIHRSYQSEELLLWWVNALTIPEDQFLNTVIKPATLAVKKRTNYKGCLRLEVRSSKALLNKMRFWQKMLVEYYQKQ